MSYYVFYKEVTNMALCEKCGGQITEEMKFCDKCGSPVEQTVPENIENVQPQFEQETVNHNIDENQQPPAISQVVNTDVIVSAKKGIKDFLKANIPENLANSDNKIFHWAGFGSLSLLALTYLICFFGFMNEMCTPVALGATGLMDGASPVWMIIYFVFGLAPVYFAYKSFKYESCKNSSIVVSAFYLFTTLFMLVVWGICDPVDFMEAGNVYAGDSPNIFAWYILSDCLSEVWYVKVILSALSILGFGIDMLVCRGK